MSERERERPGRERKRKTRERESERRLESAITEVGEGLFSPVKMMYGKH